MSVWTKTSRSVVAVAVCVCFAVVSACAQRVNLEAPSRSAPLQERVKAYQELRPTGYQESILVDRASNRTVRSSVDFLQLKDGKRVEDPRDLRPVVPADSATAKSIEVYEDKRTAAMGLYGGGMALMAVGTGVMLAGAEDLEDSSMLVLGSVVMAVGLGLLLGAYFPAKTAGNERSTAFMTYDESLADRLDLCFNAKGQVYDCGGSRAADNEVPRPDRVPTKNAKADPGAVILGTVEAANTAPDVLAAWKGEQVEVQMADGSKVFGELFKARPGELILRDADDALFTVDMLEARQVRRVQ